MAFGGKVLDVYRPSSAYPGTTVTVVAVMENTGDVVTGFYMEIYWRVDLELQVVTGRGMYVSPGAEGAETFVIPMPDHSIDLYVRLMGVNPDTNLWEQLEWAGPYPILRLSENAYSAIDYIRFPAKIKAGAADEVLCAIRNTGRLTSWLHASFYLMVDSTLTEQRPAAVWLASDDTYTYIFPFTMPPKSCQFFIRTMYVNPDTQLWAQGDVTPWVKLELDTRVYVPIAKPSFLHTFLAQGWINLEKGEWVDQWPLVIPPKSFMFGEAIEGIIDTVIEWINWIIEQLNWIWGKAVQGFDKAWQAFGMIDDWIRYAGQWFYNQVNSWWSNTWVNVQAWVNYFLDQLKGQINQAFTQITGLDVKITNLVTDYDSFKKSFMDEVKKMDPFATIIYVVAIITREGIELLQDLPDFLRDPPGWIFDRIDDWLNEEVEA